MHQKELIPHLFRTESGKITSVLCRLFSIDYLDVAEDITSETFLQALETWPYKGVPENPAAWLYTVAKNKARNQLLRNKIFTDSVAVRIRDESEGTVVAEPDLSDKNISDSQLQMLFTLCHPSIPPESQIALSLRILCGFGIGEIANALLTNKETINKRILRAKEKLRTEKVRIQFPLAADIQKRSETVLRTLYLLYNEGYYSESKDSVLREDLCMEAIRLTRMLADDPLTNSPPVNAVLALMYFHASRFAARKSENGEIVLYEQQDESLWNVEYIAQGAAFLQKAACGDTISKYHFEAAIAYWHTHKRDSPEKWENILQLYNHLLQVEYSPIAALNRTYALSKTRGTEEAIRQAEQLQLTGNHYYHTLLGELYRAVDKKKARQHFEKALGIAKTQTDKATLESKVNSLM